MRNNNSTLDYGPPDGDSEIGGLAHRLHLILAQQSGQIAAFIAARPGEGTSTIARRCAEGLAAETGKKILLIDAGPPDRARLVTDGIDPVAGIVEAVAAGHSPLKATHAVDHNVCLGRWVGRSDNRGLANRLLHDEVFWDSLKDAFGLIVIDAPSLQSSADGIALAVRADAVLLVIEAETTRQPVIENLRDILTAAGAKIIGSVMNKRQFHIPEKVYARL